MAIALMAQVRSLLANFSPLAWRYDQLSPLVFAAIKRHSFPYSSIHASMHYPHLNPHICTSPLGKLAGVGHARFHEQAPVEII